MPGEDGESEANRALIGARIKERMQSLGLKQTQLKKMVGVSQATISRWLSGEDAPKGDRMGRLASALQTSADYLTGRVESGGASDPDIIAAFIQAVREMSAGKRLQREGSHLPAAVIDRIESAAPTILAALDSVSGAAFASLAEPDQERLLQELSRHVLEIVRKRQ